MGRLGTTLAVLTLTIGCGGGGAGSAPVSVSPAENPAYEKLETWSPTHASITVSPILTPDAMTRLELFKEDSSSGSHSISKLFTIPSAPHRVQFYVKSAGRTAFQFQADNQNICTQTFIRSGLASTRNLGNARASTKITDLGGGVFKVVVAWNGTVTTSQSLKLQLDNGVTSEYAGDNREGLYLGGLQQADAIPSSAIKIATEGDSITSGAMATPWPELIQPNPGSIVINHAVTATTTSEMLSRWEGYKNDGSNWFILLGGINDIRLDVPLETTQANLAQMWSEAKSLGYTVVAMTTTPFKGDAYGCWTPARQDSQDALNTWIRSYAAAHGILLVDTWTLLLDPNNANTLNPAYDWGDHVHPSLAGNVAITNGLQTVIPQTDQTIP